MKFTEKQILFDSFLEEWDYKFKKIAFILNYLASYPELCAKLKNFQPLPAEKVMESQLEWISLIAQLDHPLDQEFFKTYWVSIQNDDYDYFIDLSSETFAIIEINYFWEEPYNWYKKYIFKDITELLTSVDIETIDIDEHLNAVDKAWFAQLCDFYDERTMLGIENKILPSEIDINLAAKSKAETTCSLSGNVLVISGVYSNFIGLLPINTRISVQSFNPRKKNIIDFIPKVNSIGGMIFLFQCNGSRNCQSYRITFIDNQDSYAEFKNHILTIKHTDQLLLHRLVEKYEIFANSETPD